VGVRFALATLAALVLAGTAAADRATDASRYLIQHRATNGGFAEPGGSPSPGLTAWAILGLRAARHCPGRSGDYLRGKPAPKATDLELRILALDALRSGCAFDANLSRQVRRLRDLRRDNGQIGRTVNSTIWGILALRATGRPAGERTRLWLLRRQRPSGGWPWSQGGRADSNDTAAAIQALVAAGFDEHARRIDRGVRFLRRLQNRDGGFELSPGRGSDTQSTAWAIQALLAADRNPGRKAFGYLRRMQRSNGSFRYNRRFVTTPVWVTSQALAALVRKPFPLR
jgi:squalene-hopene cyclase-like protein